MDMGRHTEKAVIRYQERADWRAAVAMAYLNLPEEEHRAIWFQKEAAIEYATARKLMGVEE